jgi:triosephosphate isomerase
MNLDVAQAIKLVDGIHHGLSDPGEVDVVVAPTFLSLPRIADHLRDSFIGIAAQNLHFEDQGAFTGECSGKQIKEAGADYVLLGHSERRKYFNESDEIVNKKVKAALRNELTPIVCLGETLEEREAGEVISIINKQITSGLGNLNISEVQQVIIAYEPVWAIGTGKAAGPEQVEEVHRQIRFSLLSLFDGQTAGSIRILYGGSINPQNCCQFLELANVDGVLVGGASLKANDFIEIIYSLKQ